MTQPKNTQSQQQLIASLPAHLQPFVGQQDYARYTARDHAVWRFLMHQLRDNLSHTAHSVYCQGLRETGVSVEAIPRIEEMNECLSQIGWKAVVVDGFIPPAIFMGFQAVKVLVIAVDMRAIEHMLYTPAPDILHESAGHAPFIVDTDYAEYLQLFGELGRRAVANKSDMDAYEAIRHLSVVKESPCSTAADISAAQRRLSDVTAANDKPSESALLARLHWWTVEYGLVGELDDYGIFGAGLLSSLGESVSCLDDAEVKKLPLTVNAINTAYDITETQPQLFVAKNCRHLTQVLEEFGRHMCVNRGGASAMEEAVSAATVNTAVTSAGLEVSGCISRVIKDAVGNVVYFNTQGPTQLAYDGTQLRGHGIDYHAWGFSSPIGRLQGFHRCLSDYTIDELKEKGVTIDESVNLEFLSGITVTGVLRAITREKHKNILFTFEQCTVSGEDNEVLFDPSWGLFDMATGGHISSVYGGSADQINYPLHRIPSDKVALKKTSDRETLLLLAAYQKIRDVRTSIDEDKTPATCHAEIVALLSDMQGFAEKEWLLCFELLELAKQYNAKDKCFDNLVDKLNGHFLQADGQQRELINYAFERLKNSR